MTVIAGFWWRSMPAHDEGLTLAISAALLVALCAGMTSWWTARTRLRTPWSHAGPWDPRWRRPAGIALALAIVAVSWLRTEGSAPAPLSPSTRPISTGTRWPVAVNLRPDPHRQVHGLCMRCA